MGYIGTKPANALATTEQIGDGAVGTNDLANGAVTQAKVAIGVAGTGPAFSAYRSTSNQSVTASTWTKVQCQSEEFDTAASYDNSTNYRFTPTVAGYYQISASINFAFTGTTTIGAIEIYKNGSGLKGCQNWFTFSPNNCISVSSLIYLNGSTDYLELYGFCSGTSPAFQSNQILTYFQAVMVRAA